MSILNAVINAVWRDDVLTFKIIQSSFQDSIRVGVTLYILNICYNNNKCQTYSLIYIIYTNSLQLTQIHLSTNTELP
jgi:hypothetical protein